MFRSANLLVLILFLRCSIDVLGDGVRCDCRSLRNEFRNYVAETNARVDALEDEVLGGHGGGHTAPSHKTKACRDKRFRGQGYHVSDVANLNFDTASNYCKSIGGHLPYQNMKTVGDRKHVMHMMGLNQKFFWIGLTDRDRHDVWKWEDGSIANKHTIGFARGEPSGRGEGAKSTREDCVHNWRPDAHVLSHLNDLRCNWALQNMAQYVHINFKWTLYGTAALCEFDCDHSH